jgi:hypothetical protein
MLSRRWRRGLLLLSGAALLGYAAVSVDLTH